MRGIFSPHWMTCSAADVEAWGVVEVLLDDEVGMVDAAVVSQEGHIRSIASSKVEQKRQREHAEES